MTEAVGAGDPGGYGGGASRPDGGQGASDAIRVSRVFRGKLLAFIQEAYDAGELPMTGEQAHLAQRPARSPFAIKTIPMVTAGGG